MNETVNNSDSSELLSLAVDQNNRYTGELATYHIRFRVPDHPKSVLQFALPNVIEVESTLLPPEIPPQLPSMTEIHQEQIVMIPLEAHFVVGQSYQVQFQARIKSFSLDQYLIAEASLVSGDEKLIARDAVQVAVFRKGEYLQFLPEIYDNDEFTSRFLMLFESFLKPIGTQIDQIAYYFDPDITPPVFIPWLASWLGLQMDPLLPLSRVRTLLKHAMMLYQYRGTSQALKTYLEIYTDGEVDVIEQRAKNFVLGEDSALGVDIALGTENQPNSVNVNIRATETELQRMENSEEMYYQKMRELIRTMIPAHAVINVNCAFYAEEG
jgi:phage tail-like protein